MMILADESVAAAIIDRLRSDGHSVLSIRETTPGVTDTQVLGEADKSQFLLLTEDKDFGELVYRQGASHHGVVLIRLAGVSRAVRATLVSDAIKDHQGESRRLAGALQLFESRRQRAILPSQVEVDRVAARNWDTRTLLRGARAHRFNL